MREWETLEESGTDPGDAIATAVTLLPSRGPSAIYDLLDNIAARRSLSELWLVLAPPGVEPQVFSLARRDTSVDVLSGLLAGRTGFYPVATLDAAGGSVLTALCDVTFRAASAERVAAVDRATGLLGRHVIDEALSRAAACGARYRWATTAALLTTAGEAAPEQRWRLLARALGEAMRVGDEVGVAGTGTALALLGNAGPDDVRPFVARVRAALDAHGGEGIDLLVATASTPAETVDPSEMMHLARERLAEIGGPGRSGGLLLDDRDALWRLELDLRLLPGVSWVGLEPGGSGPIVTVAAMSGSEWLEGRISDRVHEELDGASVRVLSLSEIGSVASDARASEKLPVTEPTDDVGRLAPWPRSQLRNGNGSGPRPHEESSSSPSELASSSPPLLSATAPGRSTGHRPGRRVTFVGASFDPARGLSEVTLAYGPAQSTGRAPASPLAGGAQATLTALAALHMEVPFYLVSAERARGVPGEPVVVVLGPRRASDMPGGAAERMGIATGDVDVEAAGRATLSALNRHLSKDDDTQ